MDRLDLIGAREAAALTGVSVQTVIRRIQAGELPAQRVGRDWVIQRADLDRITRKRSGPRTRYSETRKAAHRAANP